MKLPVFVFLVLRVGFAVCEYSFLGFDVLEGKIDDLKEEIRDSIGVLRNNSNSNQNTIEHKISTLMAENFKISTTQNRLEALLNENQKKSENKIQDLKDNFNIFNNRLSDSIESLKNDMKNTQKLIEGKISRIISSLDNLGELARKNQNNNDNIKTTISKVTNSLETIVTNADKSKTSVDRTIENLSTKMGEEHSELFERMVKFETLESSMLASHKSLKDQYSDIASNVSLLANNTRELLDNQYVHLIKNCEEPVKSGVYRMLNPKIQVYCEMKTFGGGWTVIQHRTDNKLNFNRSWAEYRDGFGTVGKDSEFWLGLEVIHQLTKGRNCELDVEMRDTSVIYNKGPLSYFEIRGENDRYRLKIAKNSQFYTNELSLPNNVPFSTYDRDNDEWRDGNCAQKYGIGWWFAGCPYDIYNPARGRQYGWTSQRFDTIYSRMMISCR